MAFGETLEGRPRALSREAAPGSREENAQNLKAGSPIRFLRIGKGSSPFERLLEALDEEDPPFPERGVSSGAARFYARASATPVRDGYYSGDAVKSLYVEALAPESFSAPEKPKIADLTADFADIRHQLAKTHSQAELRQLRRRCALVLHPDRVAPLDRSLAENFMAEVNAAIDRAIKGKSTVAQTP